MDPWAAAGPAIDRVFGEPASIIYTGAGLVAAPLSAIRGDEAADPFGIPRSTLRRISYEVRQADLPGTPSKASDTFTHRGHLWRIESVTRRDDIGKWVFVVADGGAA